MLTCHLVTVSTSMGRCLGMTLEGMKEKGTKSEQQDQHPNDPSSEICPPKKVCNNNFPIVQARPLNFVRLTSSKWYTGRADICCNGFSDNSLVRSWGRFSLCCARQRASRTNYSVSKPDILHRCLNDGKPRNLPTSFKLRNAEADDTRSLELGTFKHLRYS